MNFTVNIQSHTLNKTPDFIRLIERIRQCIHEREIIKEKQRYIKTYSINHYIEHIKRYINDNPLIGRALIRFYNIIKNFSPHSQDNRFPSTINFDNNGLEDKTSIDNTYSLISETNSKISLSNSKSTIGNNLHATKSTIHYIQPIGISRQTDGIMTKTTLAAINKAPHQRTTHDIEVLEHLLNRCERLRQLPKDVRRYIARSLLFLTYHPNTILTRQNFPPFLVYIIVYGHQLNTGDIYGDDSLQLIIDYRLNGLITNEINSCNLIAFFPRDIRAYENYLSDMMKHSLLEQLRIQPAFIAMQWRNDILNYFLKWSNYKQYSTDEIIYGNEEYENKNLYFILNGQISFICLLDFPSMILKHPEFSQLYHSYSKEKIQWRFLEIFILSNGHYFGFESSTIHSWYLTRSRVDIISIPKIRFKELGCFAPMIFEKLRQDFLDIYPTENSIRNSYIKYLKMNKINGNDEFNNHKKRSNNHDINLIQKINWIPEQNILNQYKEKVRLSHEYHCN